MKRKLTAALLAGVMVLAAALTGCGGSSDSEKDSGSTKAESSSSGEEVGEVSSEWSGLPKEVGHADYELDKDAIKEKGYKIGFAQCVMDHPYRTNMIKFAEEWCGEYGF